MMDGRKVLISNLAWSIAKDIEEISHRQELLMGLIEIEFGETEEDIEQNIKRLDAADKDQLDIMAAAEIDANMEDD